MNRPEIDWTAPARAAVCLGLVSGPLLAQSAGTNELVSVDDAEQQGFADSYEPWVSADGTLVAFHSDAVLVPGDTNGAGDIYLRDLDAGTTVLLSETAAGVQGNGASYFASLSADATLCVFLSDATNLVPGDTNGATDTFLKDLVTGEITRVNVTSAGDQADDGCAQAMICADGSTITFSSRATNLDGVDLNPSWDIYRHVIATGETTLVSKDSAGVQANNKCFDPVLSARGNRVAYASIADNLVPNDTNVGWDVFMHDVDTGITTRESTSSTGAQADGGSFDPMFAMDGRLIAFEADALNLVPEIYFLFSDVFVKDTLTGELFLISKNDAGKQGNLSSGSPAITPDGRWVAYRSRADNIVPGDGTGEAGWEVFLFDRETQTTERLSVDTNGDDPNSTAANPTISAGGHVVAYDSFATDLVPVDANGTIQDAFAWVSPAATWTDQGQGLAGAGGLPQLDATGKLVAFGTTEFALSNAAANAPGAYVFGVTAANLPFQGGTLVPFPDVIVPLTTNGSGEASLELTWPHFLTPGLDIHVQCWTLDAGGPQGFAASNAVSDQAN